MGPCTPAGRLSYYVQDVAQMLDTDLAWAKSRQRLNRLGWDVPVDSMDRTTRHTAEGTVDCQTQRPLPATDVFGKWLPIPDLSELAPKQTG